MEQVGKENRIDPGSIVEIEYSLGGHRMAIGV